MVTYSLDFLDEELGIYKPKQKPNWITKFRNTNMVKWFIFQIKLISKRLIHFPLILIFSLLCSSAYPNILSTINSLIISLLITFVICSKGFLYSLCFRKKSKEEPLYPTFKFHCLYFCETITKKFYIYISFLKIAYGHFLFF